jgi:hypothetical protein
VSGFQMVKKQNGCQIMAAILFLPFEILTEVFVISSLDRFVMNKYFV